MTGVEINMVVTDSLAAYQLYQTIFQTELVEKSDFPVGSNEVVSTLYGVRFHMLDENPQYQLYAPKEGQAQSIWYNILVEDIRATYDKAIEHGCQPIQAVTEIPEMGISNAIFKDPFGHVWLLHELHHVVSYEDRIKYFEEHMNNQST